VGRENSIACPTYIWKYRTFLRHAANAFLAIPVVSRNDKFPLFSKKLLPTRPRATRTHLHNEFSRKRQIRIFLRNEKSMPLSLAQRMKSLLRYAALNMPIFFFLFFINFNSEVFFSEVSKTSGFLYSLIAKLFAWRVIPFHAEECCLIPGGI